MEENIAGFNLVLLGKTGAGKSAAGNTILGREVFKSKKNAKSQTKVVSKESTTVCGCSVTVYDTPGFFDTDMSEEEIQQMINEEVLQKCESGHCVFLLVIKADRFSEEERKTVEKIEKLLGQNRLEKTWILFTRGDELEEENMTINEFINETEALKKLVQKYDQRYHVFNNKPKKPSRQVQMLITKFLTSFKTMVKGARLNPLKRKLPKKVEQDTPFSSLSSRRIVLLGKSGAGKSAAGNTILGQKKFKSVMSTCSVTSECSEKHATVSGRSLSVVDTPGLFDTHMNPEDLVTEIARSVYVSSPGPHAFLIVLRIDDRFTEHEQQIPQIIEMLFGEEVLKYSIILFTHGDQLKGQSIDKLIKESQALRGLVQQCGGRYHIFNNRDQRNREQVNNLLQKIDTMIEQNGGGHYSNEMFEDAQRFRREEEEQRQREEEERKQQDEKQRQEEIERLRKEMEERVRAEFEAKLKSDQESTDTAPIQSENTERKQEEKQQSQDKIDSVELKTDETTSANPYLFANPLVLPSVGFQPKAEPEKMIETSSGFKHFFFKYRKRFYFVAIALGALIGAGAVIGGAVIGGAVIAGAVIAGVSGAGVGGGICKFVESCLTADTKDS